MDDATAGCYLMLLLSIVCGAIGYAIGKRKGRATAGFLWGFLLGPLGLIIIALVTASQPAVAPGPAFAATAMRRCPFCAEDIRVEAVKCKHCGSELARVP